MRANKNTISPTRYSTRYKVELLFVQALPIILCWSVGVSDSRVMAPYEQLAISCCHTLPSVVGIGHQ